MKILNEEDPKVSSFFLNNKYIQVYVSVRLSSESQIILDKLELM